MKTTVKGKQLDVGDSLRTHAESSMTALTAKYFNNAIESHVTLSKDAHLYRAEITVHPTRGQMVQASAQAHEAYAAFDEAARTMAKRLQRYRSKLQDKHVPGHEEVANALAGLNTGTLNVKKVIFGAAANQPANESAAEPTGDEPLVIAEMTTPVQTLTVSQAVMQLELQDLPALLFTNKGTQTLNMIYRRTDGNIGWVDPHTVMPAATGQSANTR